MELAIHTPGGGDPGAGVTLPDKAFGAAFNEALVHQVVTAFLAGARLGTRAQKNRSAVRGGSSKPWRQKGTGRARAGTIRSPLWRGGGVTFAAAPGNYAQKVNKKMYRGALRSIFSELIRQERMVVVHDFSVDAPKTRDLVARLRELDLRDVLIVTDVADENLLLSARNLHWVDVRSVDEVDPVSLLAFQSVLITVPALRRFEERLG